MALTSLPIPREIEWERWVSAVIAFNPQLQGNVPEDGQWQEWAKRVAEIEPATLRSEGYADWREWAARLKQVFPN
jgi:hypothetical protein